MIQAGSDTSLAVYRQTSGDPTAAAAQRREALEYTPISRRRLDRSSTEK